MQSWHGWHLASVLPLRQTDSEFARSDQNPRADKLHESGAKTQKVLRENRRRCFAAAPRQRVPPEVVPQRLSQAASQNPHERRCSQT
jgi:hypothetical protein